MTESGGRMNQTRWCVPGQGTTIGDLITALQESTAVHPVQRTTAMAYLEDLKQRLGEDMRTNLQVVGNPLGDYDVQRLMNVCRI
jgi:hypothetical protein